MGLKGWERSGEKVERRGILDWGRGGAGGYMMHSPATTNKPAFFECKVYIGKYKKVS